jgi:hypothetical protein
VKVETAAHQLLLRLYSVFISDPRDPKRRYTTMPTYKKKLDFYTSKVGLMVAEELKAMVLDSRYVTKASFCADTEQYADNLIPFIDKHMAYLCNHPATDPYHYLANLKLITRVR